MYSDDAYTAWRIDSTIDSVNDVQSALFKNIFTPDEETRKAGLEKYYATTFPQWCNAIDKRIAHNSSQHHIVGDAVTIADCSLAGFLYGSAYNEGFSVHSQLKEVINNYPNLKAYAENLGLHTFKEYLDSRPKPRPF